MGLSNIAVSRLSQTWEVNGFLECFLHIQSIDLKERVGWRDIIHKHNIKNLPTSLLAYNQNKCFFKIRE